MPAIPTSAPATVRPVIRTERLVLRAFMRDDLDGYVAYRSDPETLRWLGTRVPPTLDATAAEFARWSDIGGPTEGEWYWYAIEHDGRVVGDIGCEIRTGGGIAEIGYALRPEGRGHGYASEAAAAVVDDLVAEHAIQRIEAHLATDNVASMRVLEAIGMTCEVIARSAYCFDGEWVDSMSYAMTAADRATWAGRVRTPPAEVALVEITPDDAYLWGRLRTHHSEERFVAPMALTWRDALFPESFEGVTAVPWMRGVLADGERAAFVMVSETHGTREGWFLWRLLVDRWHQRRGIGRAAIQDLVSQLRAMGVPRLYTSCVEGTGSPRPFYEGLGFTATGETVDGETELVLPLMTAPA